MEIHPLIDPYAVHASDFTQDSGVLVGTGAGTFQEEIGATLRTSLGLGTTDAVSFGAITGTSLALGAGSITMSGSIGVTGTRVTKGWFTDLECTNPIAGSITGNAATITVADESADTTCFLLFATAATGSVAAKTGSNLAFDSQSGILTVDDILISAPTNIYALNHNNFTGYSANRHIDWTNATTALVTTLGITGGSLTASGLTQTRIPVIGAAGLLTDTISLTFDGSNLLIDSDLAISVGSITSVSGAIVFGNENLSTTGSLGVGAGISSAARLRIYTGSAAVYTGIYIDSQAVTTNSAMYAIWTVPWGRGTTGPNRRVVGARFEPLHNDGDFANPPNGETARSIGVECVPEDFSGRTYTATGTGKHELIGGLFGVQAGTGNWTANPPVTTYHIYIENAIAGYGTDHTHWSIYSVGGNNFLGGALAFGQTDIAERVCSDADNYLDLYAGTNIRAHTAISIAEIAAAPADVAAYGQLWCKDNAGTTELWFTDDAGNDHQIAYV